MSQSEGRRVFERLPTNVKPILYYLALKPNLVNFQFVGVEVIKVEVLSPTNKIVLNCIDIDIQLVTFTPITGGSEMNGTVSYEKEELQEQAILKFNETIKPGKGYIRMLFVGFLNNRMVGFYRSEYRSSFSGRIVNAIATQFELAYARRAFPCWDEPNIKARFNIVVVAPDDRVVLSNTNIIKEERVPKNCDIKIVTFDTTPTMSTYLLAIVIGEYARLESTTASGTKIRVFTQKGAKERGTFALKEAINYCQFYEDYFKMNYPLNKLDHISIPGFAFGTMGNWGLCTYRDIKLYIDNDKSPLVAKMSVAQAIAHETVTQWFGALVTMKWWNQFWLFESFAIFMRYLAVESLHPDFEIYKQFTIGTTISALDLDSSHASHPIDLPVNRPAEISSTFGEVSYEKGASAIRMCHAWIGDQAFREGMNDFLKKHAYSNIDTEDLWKALEKASKKPVEKVMQTWTGQMGYPLITVSISLASDTAVVINLKQEKFCIDGKLSDSESKMLWSIPISLVTSDAPGEVKKFGLLIDRSTNITLESFSLRRGWFKLNPSLYGFYRVNYPVEIWNALGRAVRNKTMEPLDRLHLLDDMLALNQAGIVPVAALLRMLENYDNDFVNWSVVDKCLSQLGVLTAYTDSYENFQKFGRKLVAKYYAKLGFDEKPGESKSTSIMRNLVISRLVLLNDRSVIEETKRRFIGMMQGQPQASSASLRHSIFLGIAKSGDARLYDCLVQLYDVLQKHEEKVTVATALGATTDEEKIDQTLKLSMSRDLKSLDGWQIVVACSGTPQGRVAAWKYYQLNWYPLRSRYGSYELSIVQNICENFASEEKAEEITSWFNDHNSYPEDLQKAVGRAVEKIRVNAAWLEREAEPLRQFFSELALDNLLIED